MGLGDQLGTITAGKLADLLVVEGRPDDDIGVLGDPANLVAIMHEGRFVKRAL